MNPIHVLVAVVVCAAASGCATITRGTNDVLVVNSDPVGASVQISGGLQCTTPCSVELKRKRDYHLKITKPGFEPVETDVMSQIAGAGAAGMAGNVLLGGLIGVGVDAATGATKSLKPNPVEVKLIPATTQSWSSPVDRTADLNAAPIESICDQASKVDRAECRGTLKIGFTQAEVLGVLGQPDGKSEDGSVLRFGDRYLKFDVDGRLGSITDARID